MVDQPNLGPTGINPAKMRFFVIFLSLDYTFSLKLHMIARDDSPQQCLTSTGSETHEKSLGAQTWATRAKFEADFSFFGHFLRFGLLVFFGI